MSALVTFPERSGPPRFLFMQTNQRCNLKCTHCSYWLNDDSDRPNYLSTAKRLEFLSVFKSMGGEAMVTCGGEPMLDLEDYFALSHGCRELGLRCLSVVNGTRVTRATADRMILEGPSEITISLDHWKPEINDALRGVRGAHHVAVNAVKLLLESRARLGASTPIYVMTIVSEDTWRTLHEFFDYVLNELGADKLKLNIMQPTFQGRGVEDGYFSSARISDVAACLDVIRRCDETFSIRRNPEWLADVEMYLRSVKNPLLGWSSSRGTERAICNSYDRNIMLDLYGNARLCFSALFPSVKLDSPEDLREFWYESSLVNRECMVGCKQYCGISHSVRKTEATL